MKKSLLYHVFLLLFFFASCLRAQESQGFQEVKAWMGVSIEDKPEGVLVNRAIPGTPAEKAGLKPGDMIRKLDSSAVKDRKQLIDYVQSKGVGNEVTLEIEREKKILKLTLKLEAKPGELEVVQRQLIGKTLPEFQLENPAAKSAFTNKDIENKVTVIEFWATWCGPCRTSHKRLSEFVGENSSVKVIAVSNEESDLITDYMKKNTHKFTTLRDASGEFMKFFMVYAVPMTVIADRQGVIQFVSFGSGTYLEEALKNASDLDKTDSKKADSILSK